MPLTDAQRKKLEADLSSGESAAAPTQSPGSLPPAIAELVGLPAAEPYVSGFNGSKPRITVPPPDAVVRRQLAQENAKNRMSEESATRRQLLKKAADQKLQLEQAIGLFDKIFSESEQRLPTIKNPAGTLPFQRLGRFAGKELGYREVQRGVINSLQARATPALKALGEVGVLTDQDIQRMLRGGFPSDDDTDISRATKREGIVTDLRNKLEQVNRVLGTTPEEELDPNIAQLKKQFPGATIRRKQ